LDLLPKEEVRRKRGWNTYPRAKYLSVCLGEKDHRLGGSGEYRRTKLRARPEKVIYDSNAPVILSIVTSGR
jgi:hypothetical protein